MLYKKLASALIAAILLFQMLPFSPVTVTAGAEDANAIYVSVNGNDNASGSISDPLKTFAAAKNRIKSDGISGRTVFFREGTYYFDKTEEFTADDPNNITYSAFNNENVVFSGAVPLSGWSTEYLNGKAVWTTSVDGNLLDGQCSTLYSETKQLSNARLPESGFYYADGADANDANFPDNAVFQQNNSFYAKDGDVDNFYNITDVYVKIYHFWTEEISNIVSFDDTDNKVRLSVSTNCTVSQGDAYCLENVREALDKPGEWYIDKLAGKLYYVPFADETIDSTVLYAGARETMMTVSGASGLYFNNITFADSNWNLYNIGGQAAYGELKCISVARSIGVNFRNCTFKNIGGTCIYYGSQVKDSTVSGCKFEHIGSHAVAIMGDNSASSLTENITVTDNYVYKYGERREQAVAVLLTYAADCTISHNEIHSGPYTAISVGWTWGYTDTVTGGNKISDNLIYDIGHTALSDMGGIYLLGIQNGTVVSGNVVHDVAAGPDASTYGGWGIYLDEGSSNIHVKNNLVYNCDSQGFHQHYGQSNQVYNNIFALNKEGQVRCSRSEADKSDYEIYLHNNILVGDDNVMYQLVVKDRFSDDNNLYYDLAATKGLVFSGTTRTASSEDNYKPDVMKNTYGYYNNAVFADPEFIDVENENFTVGSTEAMQLCGFNSVSFENVGSYTYGSKYLVNTLAHSSAYYPAQNWNAYKNAVASAKASRTQADIVRVQAAFSALNRYSGASASNTVTNSSVWTYADGNISADTVLSVSGVSGGSSLTASNETYPGDFTHYYNNENVKAEAMSKDDRATAAVYVDRSVYTDMSQTPVTVSGAFNNAQGRSMRYYCVLQSVGNYSPSFGTPASYTVGGKTYSLTRGGWQYPFVGKDGGYDSVISEENFGGMSAKINGPVPEKNSSVSIRISAETLIYSTAKMYYYCTNHYIDLTITGVDKGELRRLYLFCVESGKTGTAMTAAKSILDSYAADQTAIDNAYAALVSAYSLNTAAKTDLKAAIDQAPAYSSAEYTAVTWSAYVQARQTAVAVYDDPSASQGEVNAARTALITAYSALVECTSLIGALTEPEDLYQSAYSQYAWYEYRSARNNAVLLLADGTAEEIAASAQALADAKSNLGNHTASNTTIHNTQTLHKYMHALTTTDFHAEGAVSGSSISPGTIDFDHEESYDGYRYYEQFDLHVASKAQSATANMYVDRSIISDLSETSLTVGADFTYITAKSMRLYYIFVSNYTPTIGNRDSITVNGKTYSINVGTYANAAIGGKNGANTKITPPLENVKGKTGKIYGPVPAAGESVSFRLAACTFNVSLQGNTFYCADNYIDFTIYGVDKAQLRQYAFTDCIPQMDADAYSQDSYSAYQTALTNAVNIIYRDDVPQAQIDAAAQALKDAYDNLKIIKQSRVTVDLGSAGEKVNLAVWQTVNYNASRCGYPSHSDHNCTYSINDFTVSFNLKSLTQGYAFLPMHLYTSPGGKYTLTLKTSSNNLQCLVNNPSYSHGWNLFPNYYQLSNISYTQQPDGTYLYRATLQISPDETVDGAYLRLEANNTMDTIYVQDISLTDAVSDGKVFDETCYYGDVLFLPEVSKEGCHFAGWRLSDGSMLGSNRLTVGTQDETVTPVWADPVLRSDIYTVDYASGIISGLAAGQPFAAEQFYLTDTGCTVAVSGGSTAKTGITVEVIRDGKTYESYTSVLAGDINGDGRLDGCDSVLARAAAAGMLNSGNTAAANYLAADVNSDGSFNEADAAILDSAGVFLQ